MAEVSTELAGKVLGADLRNLIQKVGAGGNLTASERQMFIDFSRAEAGADDLGAARVNALLRKWIHGGRLTTDEKLEISHILPLADRADRTIYQGKAEDVAASLGLARKTFFTWKKHGEKHGDLLPINDPAAVPLWYERMMTRRVFKHKIDPRIKAKCLAQRSKPEAAGNGPAAGSGSSTAQGTKHGSVSSFMQAGNLGPTGVGVEIVALEERCAAQRLAMDHAHQRGDAVEAERLSERLDDMLETLRKLKQSAENDKLIEQRILTAVQEDLSVFVPAAISNLLFMGAKIFPQARSALPRHEFLAMFRTQLMECFSGLRLSKFAPALEGELMKHLLAA